MSLKDPVTVKSLGWEISGQMSMDVTSKAAVDEQEREGETRRVRLENAVTLTHERLWLLETH